MRLPTVLLLLIALLLATARAWAIAPDDLLPADAAFVLDARGEADTVTLQWDIAPGYYLYRDRIRVEALDGAQLGQPALPEALSKDDPFFGLTAIYRDSVTVTVPIIQAQGKLRLSVTYQGCADLGVCYPPETRTLDIALGSDGGSTDASPLTGLFRDPSAAGAPIPGASDLLPGEQAFILSVDAIAADRLLLRWSIAEGYYLYRDKLALRLGTGSSLSVAGFDFPPGDIETDEFFGEQTVYRGAVTIPVRLSGEWPEGRSLEVTADYQGCADIGVCYPPMSTIVPVSLGDTGTAASPTTPPPVLAAQVTVSEQDHLAERLVAGGVWALPLFFGLGLLLSVTPCVLPMVPILSAVVVGQGSALGTRRAVLLSLAYVLGMALTYTAAGVAAAALGQGIQAWFQHPAVLALTAALFVGLALAMFGLFHLQMPASVQSHLQRWTHENHHGGRYGGVALLGVLSALIVGPCMAPPLVGILTVIAQTGDLVLGGLALFTLSLGMGVPLIIVAASAGHWLPRSGQWMSAVNAVFGVLMLAVALYLLERILPPLVSMIGWAVLLIVCAVYLGALEPVRRGWPALAKGLGLVLLIYGGLILTGAAAGGRDPWAPLAGASWLADRSSGQPSADAFQTVSTLAELDRIIGASGGQSVIVEYYADWCVSCKELERDTFSDPAVQQAWAESIRLRVDVTANNAEDRALLARYGLFGPPAILFFGPDGRERKGYRVVGYMAPQRFAAHVSAATRG